MKKFEVYVQSMTQKFKHIHMWYESVMNPLWKTIYMKY